MNSHIILSIAVIFSLQAINIVGAVIKKNWHSALGWVSSAVAIFCYYQLLLK